MHKAKTVLTGELVTFKGVIMVDTMSNSFASSSNPFSQRLRPVFFLSFSSFSSLLQHTRTGFACITIFVKGAHPGGYCEQIFERKEKKLEKDLIFCIFEKNAPRGHGMGKRKKAGGYDRFP